MIVLHLSGTRAESWRSHLYRFRSSLNVNCKIIFFCGHCEVAIICIFIIFFDFGCGFWIFLLLLILSNVFDEYVRAETIIILANFAVKEQLNILKIFEYKLNHVGFFCGEIF